MHDHRHRPPLRLVTESDGPIVAPPRRRPRRGRRVDWSEIGVFVLMLTSVGASVEALRSATAPRMPATAAAPGEATWVAQTIQTPAPKTAPHPPAPPETGEVAL